LPRESIWNSSRDTWGQSDWD